MSGSSCDGLDIAFIHLEEARGVWQFEIVHADCIPYTAIWKEKLLGADALSALDFQYLHHEYGAYTGALVKEFIAKHALEYKVQLIGSHGHTVFHEPTKGISIQAGSGAAIAAATGINVISDLRSMDTALGGQGAPIVPIGEQALFADYDYCLNIGGISNLSIKKDGNWLAWDICAANRVLNALASTQNRSFDAEGKIAASGKLNTALLTKLNELGYYQQQPPKSLNNSFGDDEVLRIIQHASIDTADALHTYCRHIAQQILYSILPNAINQAPAKMLVTGGGAFNSFLMQCILKELQTIPISISIPDATVIQYKEALIMGFLAVLRWREEYTCHAASTGAIRNSIGGAVWMGQEA